MAGKLELRDRKELESARDALRILRAALARLSRCETCAVATVSGGRCRRCKLAYVDGNPVPVRSTTIVRRRADSATESPRDEPRSDTPPANDRKDVPRAKG